MAGMWEGAVSLVIDGVMVVAMVGLWWLWLQNMRRQRDVELKLEAASAQLQEATEQLNALMPLLSELSDPRPSPRRREEPPERKAEVSPPPEKNSVDTSSADTRLAQLLRLRREGMGAEEIARQIDMPLAQVRLLLRVHRRSVESLS